MLIFRDWATCAVANVDNHLVVASHADILRGASNVPAPRMSADLSGKNVDQSQQTSRSGSALWTLKYFALDFIAPEKFRKVLRKVKTLTAKQTKEQQQNTGYNKLLS